MKINSRLKMLARAKRVLKKHLSKKETSGQMIILFALMASMMFLFAGMGIDFGLMYLDKAKLSRAVDSLGIKLAGNLPTNWADNAEISMDIIRANFPGFLSNVVRTTNTTNFSPVGSVTTNATPLGSGSNCYQIYVTNNNQTLKIDTAAAVVTNVTPNLKIVTVQASASTRHDTYFLRLAGISNIMLGESATAERAPKIIVLILDISGSMTGDSGYTCLPTAVTNFVNNFTNSQDQDFLAVITFSSYATLMWPTNYLGSYSNYQSQMLPGNNFVTPIKSFMTNTAASGGTNALISQGIRFKGVTCAQEGMRLGYQVMNNLLGSITDTSLRAKLQTYYILFTDGQFNTTRTYVRGRGFGIAADGSVSNHSASNLPFFHKDIPLMCNGNDFSQYTNVLMYTSTNTGATPSNYNLNIAARFGNYAGGSNITWSNFLASVNCTLTAVTEHYSYWKHYGTNYPAGSLDFHMPSSVPICWTNQPTNACLPTYTNAARNSSFWTTTNNTRYVITNCMNHGLWVSNTFTNDDGRGWTSWNNKIFTNTNLLITNTATANAAACFSTNATGGRTNMYWLALYELFKNSADPIMILPTPILFTNQNPTMQSWYPTNSPDYNMNTRTLSHYPSGRTFANIYGFYCDRAGTANRTGCTLPDSDTNGDVFQSIRMSDFYPEFTFGPHPTNILNDTNTLIYPDHVVNYITNHTTGIYYKMYSFRDTNWKDFTYDASAFPTTANSASTTSNILDEGNWLTMMQAWIARKEQNAKIYLINFYYNDNEVEKRNICNDKSGSNGSGVKPFFADQPSGAFYFTSNQSTLNDAFDDIAGKINTRLTK